MRLAYIVRPGSVLSLLVIHITQSLSVIAHSDRHPKIRTVYRIYVATYDRFTYFTTDSRFFLDLHILHIMKDGYNDFSALDAPPHLTHTLQYFFTDTRNVYDYGLAHKHFTDIITQSEFATSKKLFKIIMGTNLVTNKLVMSYKTDQGFRYMIQKVYFQQVERMVRTTNRSIKRQDTDTNFGTQTPRSQAQSTSNTLSPFIRAMNEIEDTSSDDDSHSAAQTDSTDLSPSIIDPVQQTTPSVTDITLPTPTDTPTPHNTSITSDVTEHTANLERNMSRALQDLKDTDEETSIPDQLTPIVTKLINEKLHSTLQSLDEKATILDSRSNDCLKLSSKLTSLIASTNALHSKLETQHEKMEQKLSYLHRKISESEKVLDDIKISSNEHIKTLQNHLDSVQTPQQVNTTNIETVASKFKRRLNRLKDTTAKLFEQHDNDNDLLHDRILRIEENIRNITHQSKMSKPTTPRALFPTESTDNSDDAPPVTSKSQSKFGQSYSPQPHLSNMNTRQTIPNMEYLRKNVNMTCSDQDQILDFYIRLRLAVAKGGIYMKPIEDITKHTSLASTDPVQPPEDINIQSNALFTLLSNEKFIPHDFVMAQNCMRAHTANMDGFGALKAMLKLTHPTLTSKRPPSSAPTLSDSQDIHTYEHSLKNFYLLHKLYNNTTFTPLEKAKQYIRGLDDDQYVDAANRIRHQLDTVQTMNVTLHDDYKIENITSTILNIMNEYDTNTTVIRAMRFSKPFNRPQTTYKYNRFRNETMAEKPFNSRQRKFTKAQCHACKQYGHLVTHCPLLPKVLAIITFSKKNTEKCEHILRQHIQNNSVDYKKTFVRTLQGIDVLPMDGNSDDYMEEDIVIHTTIDNAIHPTDIVSDE